MRTPARAAVQDAAQKARRADQGAGRIAVELVDLCVAVGACHVVGEPPRMLDLGGLAADMGNAGPVARIDPVVGDQRLHQPLRLLGKVPEPARHVRAVPRLQFVLLAPLAGPHMPAVAPGGTEADALGLQQHDVITALGEMQGGRQSHIAPAHDADIGLLRAAQCGKGRQRRGRRGIPGRRIFSGPVVGVQQVHTASSRCWRSQGLMTSRNSLCSSRLTAS
jgi:hypothetical protein